MFQRLVVALIFVLFKLTAAQAADGHVQYDDLRKQEQGSRVRQDAAKFASGGGRLAFVVKGGDDATLGTIYSFLEEVELSTGKDVWFLHEDDNKPNVDAVDVDVYASGSFIDTVQVYLADKEPLDQLSQTIYNGRALTQ